MRILFLVGSLRMGGAERVVSRLANYWASQGHDIALGTLYHRETDAYAVDPRVERFDFDLVSPGHSPFKMVRRFKTLWMILKRLWRIHRTTTSFKPDIIISFMTTMNLMALLVQPFTKVPLIISERSNPDRQNLSVRYAKMRRKMYPYARKIVMVSQGVADAYPWLPAGKKVIIHNPLDLPHGEKPLRAPHKEIVTLGRLTKIKGHDLLVHAFAKIAAKHPDWTLKIYGEGDYRPVIEQAIAASGFADRITLAGHTSEPAQALAKSGIFVLSSHHEGFPNALIEAMSLGLPVISFDCPFGPSEIITHGQDGLLVQPQDIDQLANAMDDMIAHPAEREAMAERASTIATRLEIGTIAAQWEALIAEMIGQR